MVGFSEVSPFLENADCPTSGKFLLHLARKCDMAHFEDTALRTFPRWRYALHPQQKIPKFFSGD